MTTMRAVSVGPGRDHLEEASIMSGVPAPAPLRVPSLVPALNPIVRRLLGAGLPFGPNVLLTVRGRVSGEPRTVPVAILEQEGRRFVQSPFGEVNWVRNLRVAGRATLTRGREHEVVDAVELTPEEAGPILGAALAPYRRSRLLAPLLGRFFRIPRDATPDDEVAEARCHPMFELLVRADVA
jgi:deazaflavin-dependent oxidoreductase (nitroreductase family)